MPEYPVRIPRTERQRAVAQSIESYINLRFESITAERMTFSYSVIAADLGLSVDVVQNVLGPLEGGDSGLMVWRDKRRKPRT
jgi:hypothetical protein